VITFNYSLGIKNRVFCMQVNMLRSKFSVILYCAEAAHKIHKIEIGAYKIRLMVLLSISQE